jgi:hypothetical protein
VTDTDTSGVRRWARLNRDVLYSASAIAGFAVFSALSGRGA